MQRVMGAILILGFLTFAAPANAGPNALDPRGKTADEILAHYGLGSGEGCLQFVDSTAVDFRKEQWLRAIQSMYVADPELVLAWIVGASAPPARAAREAEKQRDCMMARMVFDAADPRSELVLDWQKDRATKVQMAGVATRFKQSHDFARKMVSTITESAYRDARTQSWIWKRKFVFSGRNFNVVSARAAAKCGIVVGHTWKPGDTTHRQCWGDLLTEEEREHEILQASAAPGISRHHWGTDFDFFGLNPTHFLARGRHADEYAWMTAHAVEFGFFQPYTTNDTSHGHRYMEERWHWSYFPIGQALLEFAQTHQDAVEGALARQWDAFEVRWNAGHARERAFFGFIRAHWREFMFNVDDMKMRKRPTVE